MTRKCAWCGKVLGEVCPHCMSEAVHVSRRMTWRGLVLYYLLSLSKFREVQIYICPGSLRFGQASCNMILFAGGLGGVSHGICEQCSAAEQMRMRAQSRQSL